MIKTFICDRCGAEVDKDHTAIIWCSWITGPEKIPLHHAIEEDTNARDMKYQN